jgi:hypothetical protein
MLPIDLWHAADRFRELYFKAVGRSHGVSSYGDYELGSPTWARCLTTDDQMHAAEQFRAAAVAMFGVFRAEDKKWTLDEELMKLVIPAILSDKKETTQAAIARARSAYSGKAQVGASGGTIVAEALHRLSLHFRFRER